MNINPNERENISPNSAERKFFTGNIRFMKREDPAQLKPILTAWIINPDTRQPLYNEIEESLRSMQTSIDGLNNRTYFVAEFEQNVIGVIGLKPPDEKMRDFARTSNPAELINAYVAPGQTGGGVGRALVARLEQEAKKRGHTEIILNSGPRYERSGWGFYDKLFGYQRVGIAENYYGEGKDAPVWSKIIERKK